MVLKRLTGTKTTQLHGFPISGIPLSTTIPKVHLYHSFESWNSGRVNQMIDDASQLYTHPYNKGIQYLKMKNNVLTQLEND